MKRLRTRLALWLAPWLKPAPLSFTTSSGQGFTDLKLTGLTGYRVSEGNTRDGWIRDDLKILAEEQKALARRSAALAKQEAKIISNALTYNYFKPNA